MAPDLDVETLRLLVCIDETGSISAAARAFDLSQPAVSLRIRALEARWRLVLIERTPRGSTLTQEGAAVVMWARRVLHEVDVMRASLSALTGERRSTLSVAASLTIAEFMLPRWMGELQERNAGLHPHLRVVNSESVELLVRAGEADIGFIETATMPVDLATRRIGSDRLVIVTRPDHPWARRSDPVDQDQLASTAFVLREPGSGTRSTFERALRREPQTSLEASSTTALLGAVLAGMGPAVVSARAVAPHLELGRLVAIPHALNLRRPLTAIWDKGRRFNDHAQQLLTIAIADRGGG